MTTVDAAIVEKVGSKKEAFVALDEILSPDALLLPTSRVKSAAHTSSPRRLSERR
jgi:hypothetical protein